MYASVCCRTRTCLVGYLDHATNGLLSLLEEDSLRAPGRQALQHSVTHTSYVDIDTSIQTCTQVHVCKHTHT